MSGPTLLLLPGVIRQSACGAWPGSWCQPQAAIAGSWRDTYGAAGYRKPKEASQETSRAGVSLGLGIPEFSLLFFFYF